MSSNNRPPKGNQGPAGPQMIEQDTKFWKHPVVQRDNTTALQKLRDPERFDEVYSAPNAAFAVDPHVARCRHYLKLALVRYRKHPNLTGTSVNMTLLQTELANVLRELGMVNADVAAVIRDAGGVKNCP